MRYRILLAGLVVATALPAAFAQRTIRWETNIESAIRQAQRANRPIMYHVMYTGQEEYEELEEKQTRAFADPRVARAARAFVPLRVYRTRDQDLLNSVGIPTHSGSDLIIFWTTPQGKLLDRISAGGATQPESLLQKMETIWEKYRQEILESYRPRLEDESTDARELVTILRELRELGIPEADELIIPLLEREELDPTVRREVIETLAELGTEKSARRVFELSLETDDPRLAREAASRLLRSDPPVALYLLQYLEDEDEARRVAAYDAIAKIAQVRNTRRGDFWQTASEDQKKQAIDHLRKEAGERVQRWEERQRR